MKQKDISYEYQIKISSPEHKFQTLRYPAILVDSINTDNGIATLLESLGFVNVIDRSSQIGWMKNGDTFASWEKIQIDKTPPLTWDELKTMEGKPVWIEGCGFSHGFWVIIDYFSVGDEDFIALGGDEFLKQDMTDENNGDSWQAFRKERK